MVRAGLQDALVFSDSRDHLLLTAEGEAEWLLAVNIFASLAGGNSHCFVPMVWRGDHHGINVVAGE